MGSQNRIVFAVVLLIVAATGFYYFNRFADRERPIISQPREILPRGDLADFETSTITIWDIQ